MSLQPIIDPDAEIVSVEIIKNHPSTDDRSNARRVALQILYEVDAVGHLGSRVYYRHIRVQPLSRNARRYTRKLVSGVLAHRRALDHAIRRFAKEYPLEQLALIDRNILRLSLYEFAVRRLVNERIAIDEAVELAKAFGSDSSAAFVNGVLGAITRDPDAMQALNAAYKGQAPR